jgi:hypothetical protein
MSKNKKAGKEDSDKKSSIQKASIKKREQNSLGKSSVESGADRNSKGRGDHENSRDIKKFNSSGFNEHLKGNSGGKLKNKKKVVERFEIEEVQ